MIPNRVSSQITKASVDQILASIAAIQAALPFLIGLDPSERKTMLKAGDRSQAFIRKALEVGQRIADHLPRSTSLDEMSKDLALMDAIYPIMIALSELSEKLSDTYAVLNSEAYASALVVYRHAKDIKGEKGLEQPVAELGRRFVRRSRTDATSNDSSEG